MTQISIVIPARNEEGNLPVLCKELSEVLSTLQYEYEILIVDDGSTDSSWKTIQTLHQQQVGIFGIKLSRNFGHQNALMAGLHFASGDAVITMDADMQHPPSVLPSLISRWEQGYKAVNTLRIATEKEGFGKRVTSKFFYRVFSWLSGSPLKSGMADFRLLDRSIVEVLTSFQEPHIFFRGLIPWVGFSSTDVEYKSPPRLSGSAQYSFRMMVRFALAGLTSFSIFPLRISILIGIITAGLAFIELFYVLFTAIIAETSVPGWASTLGLMSFLFGILFILLGVIGEYIGRIFETVKGRPQFIIQDALNTPGLKQAKKSQTDGD
jgi:dolichol-phosphate mannosyltransferase